MWRYFLVTAAVALLDSPASAAKRDFKGLFGSYRQEKYIENEARGTAFGVDVLLSTLLPLSPIVKSTEKTGGAESSLHYSAFFNYELDFFLTIQYDWEIFLNVGYYNYDTRKQNSDTSPPPDPANPQFHQFEMTALPLLLGVKYRFSSDDLVPFIGAGAGFSYIRRKGSYDYSPSFDQQYLNVLTAELIAGLQFYFTSQAGIRLEAAAYYYRLPARTFSIPASSLPTLSYQPNPWSIRYASGLFLLF